MIPLGICLGCVRGRVLLRVNVCAQMGTDVCVDIVCVFMIAVKM